MDATTRRWLCDRITSGKSGLVLVNPKWWGSEEAGKAAVGMTPARRADAGEILRGFPAPAMNRADPLPDDNIHHGGAYSHPGVYALADDFFATPESLASRVVQVYRDDKVRAAVLGYRISGDGIHALTPYSAGNSGATLVHYDYWMALAARAVLYAAGRVPASRIEGLEISPTRWTATVTGPAASLWYRARDIWGRENASGEVPVRGGQVALRGVPLPPRAVVDLILKDKGGAVLDWYSRAVPPAAGTRITGITLDREAYGKGDTLRGRATLQATAGGQYLLSVFLGDHEGRRLVRQQVPLRLAPGSAEAGFQMVIPPSSDSLLMRVEAVLTRGPEILDTRSADCPVPRTGFEGFFNGMCDRANNGAVDRMRRRLFRDEYGVNLMMHSGDGGYAVLPRDNLAHFEYTTHLGYPQSEETFKPWIEDWESFLPKNLRCDVQKLLPFRPLFYSLGEEHFLILGGSKHPLAVARFQQHLRRRYGSLEKLNEVWRSAFTSWEQVGMLPPAVIDVMTMDFGVQAFESRRFMEHLFADKHATLAEYFRRQDPHAKVGIHVGWDLWMGRSYDYWLLSRGMESMIGYGGVHNQYIRSFFRNYYGSWWHYDIGSHDNVRWHPWYMLMSGARGFMWYTMAPQIWGATTADLHPSSDWQAAAPEVKAAARMGDLLARTQYVQDQVAIHYSQDSMHAGMGPALSWTHNSFVNLLFDGGVPFHFLSYDQLAEGKARGVPLLILPGSISLSPGEVTAIRDHVRRGGVVWANTLPGTYDQFGRRLPASPLADLFAGLEERSLPGGGTARVSRDGRVVLGDIGNYLYDRNTGAHRPAQELLDAIVKLAGVQRVGRVLNAADGRPANGVWLSGYRRGGHRYLVACKDYQLVDQAPARVDLSFGPAAHVYDARSGRYLGRISSVRDTLQPTRGKVYSLLPYQVRGLGARAGRAARGQDLVVDVKMATSAPVGPDDLHVLRVSVISPGGKEVTALRRLASIRGGAGQVLLPLAHDDAPGRWTVRLQDTATCVASTVTVDMK